LRTNDLVTYLPALLPATRANTHSTAYVSIFVSKLLNIPFSIKESLFCHVIL